MYDGGDCCSSDVNREYCYECNCHHEENCALGFHHQVADGLCHDQTNNALCNYDGGDCCGECVNTDNCLNCVCHAESTILQCKLSYFIQDQFSIYSTSVTYHSLTTDFYFFQILQQLNFAQIEFPFSKDQVNIENLSTNVHVKRISV